MPAVLLFAALVACAPESFDDCGDAACRAGMALRDWDADPDGTTARVAALPDEVERLYVVEKLVEAHPGQTRALCAALPPGDARRRCERMNARPHLAGHAPEPARKARIARTAPGPALTVLPSVSLPLARTGAPPDACADAPDRGACIEGEARALVQAGQAGAVPETCARQADEKMRDECVFFAAERVIEAEHADGYATAAALCSAAGEFAAPCQMHLLLYTVRATPLAEAMTEADAAEAAAFATAVHAAWAPVDAAAGDAMAGWFWGRWLDGAYAETTTVTGTPLDLLPTEAAPHVRAAAAARLQAQGKLAGTLAERVATVETALATRPAPTGQGTFRAHQAQGASRWPEDGSPEEAATPAAWFLGRDRRPVDPDPAVDVALCVVAAAGDADDVALLAEARASATPIVAHFATWLSRSPAHGPVNHPGGSPPSAPPGG